MSRWWPERATLWLAPRQGEDALACARQALDARAPRQHARITWAIGGALARHRIVPWSDALAGAAQRQGLAKSCFIEAYGEAARGWTVREHGVRHGASSLACGIDAALLVGLAALAHERRLRLVSVQPSLMYAHNLLCPELAGNRYWFVWEEAGLATLVLLARGEPLHLKTLPLATVQLASLLDREWFLGGIEGPRCPAYLVRAETGGLLQVSEGSGWQITELALPRDAALVASSPTRTELEAA